LGPITQRLESADLRLRSRFRCDIFSVRYAKGQTGIRTPVSILSIALPPIVLCEVMADDSKITSLNCVVCQRPVDLRGAVIDERSRAVHEDCYPKVVLLSTNVRSQLKAG
jgi:hypothetical protein